jgi:hypothetical protein
VLVSTPTRCDREDVGRPARRERGPRAGSGDHEQSATRQTSETLQIR